MRGQDPQEREGTNSGLEPIPDAADGGYLGSAFDLLEATAEASIGLTAAAESVPRQASGWIGIVDPMDALLNEAIGRTPLVRLERVVPEACGEVWVKLESGNPTGSYKDRWLCR